MNHFRGQYLPRISSLILQWPKNSGVVSGGGSVPAAHEHSWLGRSLWQASRNAGIISITLPCFTSSLKLQNLPKSPRLDELEKEAAALCPLTVHGCFPAAKKLHLFPLAPSFPSSGKGF